MWMVKCLAELFSTTRKRLLAFLGEVVVRRENPGPSGRIWLRVLGVLLCCGLGAAPASSQHTASIVGQVRAANGQVIPSGVTVTLETGEGMSVFQQPANSEGQFEFENLRKIAYRLTVTADGFQPAQKDIDLRYGANQTIVNIFLMPEAKVKMVPAGLASLTDMSASGKAHREYEKGVRALESKDVAGARTHFELAVADYPCYARAQTDLALALSAQHEMQRAEAALKKAIECDPGFLDSYIQFGQVLNLQRRFAQSEAILEEGMRRSASAWQFHYQLGVAHYGLKEYVKAEKDYLEVEALNPKPPADLHVKLADVYLKQGAYDKAYPEMRAYLRDAPDGPWASKIKNIMQQMESAGVLHPANAQPAQPLPPKQ